MHPANFMGELLLWELISFNDWKHSHIIHDHDNNAEYKACLIKY